MLEVGIGSGLNLPYYTDRVRRVFGLDPSVQLQQMARTRAAGLPFEVEFMSQAAECPIALPTGSIDTVVLTWTLCSVDDPGLTLNEVRRVLKTDGRLVFIEHGSASELRVRTWQHRITPCWKRLTGGCHLNRHIRDILSRSGLECVDCQEGYLPGPRPLRFTYRGVAGRAAT
ncbi:MAG: class I SAM-dependent methyltransferase [Bryobacterales bacterium]|nr:class I SAM-dependent methyltransferase [Bryobacterales bacterium]